MNTLHFDCQAGISGDMTVGALLDLGVPLEVIEAGLAKLSLPVGSFRLTEERTSRHGISACKFTVTAGNDHAHRHYSEIAVMLASSTLSDRVRELSTRIFRRLAEAEAKVHGIPLESVHFHEVGAIDSIVDIVGTAIGLDHLKIGRITSSTVPLCNGFVQCAHGLLPLPAPATAELMCGMPVHRASGPGERVTPTGAAILAVLAESFDSIPPMKIERAGYGAGDHDFPDIPNTLRLFLGSAESAYGERMIVTETNIDDSTPEVLGHVMERLLTEGAADVWFTPVQMKKCRPGVMLSFISNPDLVEKLSILVFQESSVIGVRCYPVSRSILERQVELRETSLGPVRFKVTAWGEKPEFEDCRRIAAETGIPLREVQKILTGEHS